jgi:hypothetical protein
MDRCLPWKIASQFRGKWFEENWMVPYSENIKRSRKLARLLGFLIALLLSSCSPAFSGQTGTQEGPALLFEEDFTDPESGWEISSQGGLKDYYNGTYHIKIDDPNIFSWSVIDQAYGDVIIEVDVAFTGSADMAEMGLICRMVNNQDFYFLTIRSDGAFAIFKMYQGKEFFLGMDGYQFSPDINAGLNTNHIKAECKRDQLSLYANGIHLVTVTDASYQVGDVGLIAGAFEQTDVNVFFDNFQVIRP